MPEVVDRALADDMRVQLGEPSDAKDMRITFHAARRRMAEGLADEDRARFEHGGRHPARSRGAGGGGSQDDDRYGASHAAAWRRFAEGARSA